MQIKRTKLFEKRMKELGGEVVMRAIENHIAGNLQVGDVIPGMGGVRKMRFAMPGIGKRGSGRAIYYYTTKSTY